MINIHAVVEGNSGPVCVQHACRSLKISARVIEITLASFGPGCSSASQPPPANLQIEVPAERFKEDAES
jgi:hypothetical protein